ncbi:MAG: zinc-binding dehydrogenase [Candidatus Dormibacteraeota bacterium]|nr:zinc-binding dehydrogenase [Candidatus Dormibacteraeota bacterium]
MATRLGGPEVLELQEVPAPDPGPSQVLIKVHRAGVNFADLSSTLGRYPQAPPPPFIPGLEVSGHAVATGRPVFAIVPSGGYAEFVAADLAWSADGLDLDDAAGYPLAGLTAFFALRHVGRLVRGETVLVTAAAGGVGSSAIQVARALGAGRVIGIAGTPEKRARVAELGADEAIGYEDPIPGPVDVMVDMVGGEVFQRALEAMAPFGRMVCIGSTSGQVQQIPGVGDLRVRGVGVLPFSMGALRARHPDVFAKTSAEGIELIRRGALRPPVGRVLPLAEAAEAHRLLGSRASMGKLLLKIG